MLATFLPGAANARSAQLIWNAPGDDGMIGKASLYDIRVSFSPITEANFSRAMPSSTFPVPAKAGTEQSVTISGLSSTHGYYFAMKAVDSAGNWSHLSNVVYLRPEGAVGINDEAVVLSFSAPIPNPAVRSARLQYVLPQATNVEVEIYDVAGRHVRTLSKGRREAGKGELVWDLRDDSGRPAGAGLHLIRARIGDQTFTRRVTTLN